MERLATPPSRSTGTITLSFGIIAIPLAVFTGQSESGFSRKEFYKDTDVEVGRVMVRKDTGETIEWGDVERRVMASNGVRVVVDDAEVQTATMPRGQAEIVARLPVKAIGDYLVSEVRQVRNKAVKGKFNPAEVRAFALLRSVLKSEKSALLIRASLRGPAKHYILTADGDLFTVVPTDTIREALPQAVVALTPDEKKLAKVLLETIPTEVPVITDDTAAQVQAYADAKAKGKAPKPVVSTAGSPEDLAAALVASVAAAKAAKATA